MRRRGFLRAVAAIVVAPAVLARAGRAPAAVDPVVDPAIEHGAPVVLGDLTDVAVGAGDGDVLAWNGSVMRWVPIGYVSESSYRREWLRLPDDEGSE